jgi:hypothetical protein
MAAEYRSRAARLANSARNAYWDSNRRMFADTDDKAEFSQQANALAVLAGVISGDAARDLMSRVALDDSLVQCSIYFRHYLHAAMNQAGLGDRYLDMLGPWRTQLSLGLTTWAETAEPSRSDCHAWGASPNFELFRTVLGIDSAAPGFRRVSIRPNLGKLAKASGSIPHPRGEIRVTLELKGTSLDGEVVLPEATTGQLLYRGTKLDLHAGSNPVRTAP